MKFKDFIYDGETRLGYDGHGFLNPGSENYHDVLFSFLDENNEFGNDFPLHCRVILILSLFKKENRPNMYSLCGGRHTRPDFQGIYDYLNLSLSIKKTSLSKIQERIDYLNSLKEKLGIKEDLTLNLLQENIFVDENDNQNNWDVYLLKGSRIWISSGPIISFFAGIIKYGFDEKQLIKTLNCHSVDNFVKKYSKSNLCSDNLDLIKEYFSDLKWLDCPSNGEIYTQMGVNYYLNH